MTEQRPLYASPNGDRWSLCRAEGEIFVLHEPNAPSGGRPVRIGLARFLGDHPAAPEQRALLDLVGSLVAADAPPVTGAPPEAGAAAAEPSPGENAV